MKILHIINNLKPGGKERQLVEFLKGIKDKKNIQCEVVLLNKQIHYKEVNDLGIKIHILDQNDNDRQYIFLKLFKICKTVRPDIIHAWGFKETRYAILPAKLFKIKLIHFGIQYGMEIKKFSRLWWYGKLTFPFSDIIMANSKAGLKTHKLNESSKVRYVYNGFDLNRIPKYSNDKLKKELSAEESYVIGMVANFTKGKDHQTLIEAGKKILKNRKDILILFIGDGPTRNYMEAFVQDENKGNFRFLGRRNDVEDIVKDIDIGVLLAKTGHAEGISNAIMEYMALGKPVIATRIGGNTELVVEGKTGFLIKHNDVDALIDKIYFLFANPAFKLKMGRNGQQRIKEVFNLDKMVINFIEIYNQLITN